MPLLPKEVDVFPADLLEPERVDETSACWCVAHTPSRQEKALARQLLTLQVPFYLPLIRKTFLIKGRRFESYVPTFPGYLFVFAEQMQYDEALTTRRVVKFLHVADQQLLHSQLRQVKRLSDAGLPLYPENRLAAGRHVRITGGPLMGLVGVVVRRKGASRFIVAVDIIQRGVSVDVPGDILEPIDEAAV